MDLPLGNNPGNNQNPQKGMGKKEPRILLKYPRTKDMGKISPNPFKELRKEPIIKSSEIPNQLLPN